MLLPCAEREAFAWSLLRKNTSSPESPCREDANRAALASVVTVEDASYAYANEAVVYCHVPVVPFMKNLFNHDA